jgi:hypothetical protein
MKLLAKKEEQMNPINISPETARRIAEMDQTLLFHRVMTQAHRWFQPYEQSECDLQNQLDILVSDVHIQTSLGEANGHRVYAQRFASLPANWRNAHHVQTATVRRLNADKSTLTMEIVYQNSGFLPDGKLASNRLRYTCQLTDGNALLPKFKDIANELIGPETTPAFATFAEAYTQNRVRSLAHYWLALIELNTGDATPFQEIVTPDTNFAFTTQDVNTFADFQQWFQTTSEHVLKSSHTIEHFAVEQMEANRSLVIMEFEWSGFARDNPAQELEARTRHEWVVTDHPRERFARIQSIKVQALKPFQPRAR